MAGNRSDAGAVARVRFRLRPLPRGFRLHVRDLLCGSRLSDFALVFLYYSAWVFVYGGELNAAIARVGEKTT